jgi:aspartate aminotransferase
MHIASRLNRIKASVSSMGRQRARELRDAGRDVISLTTGEPDFDTPEHVCEAAARAMASGQTKYTDPGGTPELKEAIREKLKRENGLEYTLDEIIVSTGAKQVVFNALMSTVEHADEVIVPVPCWVSYPDVARLAGGTPLFVSCPRERGFKLESEQLEGAITARTRWLVLNAPNNPSGALYTREELKALTEVLMRHPHVALLTDDIYEHIRYDGREFVTALQLEPALRDRTLVVNGVSKAYAMTGWRIGYGAGPAPLINAMLTLQSQSTSNPCSISQAAAIAALRGPQESVARNTATFQMRRDKVIDSLNAMPGISCYRPEGAFYAFASCEGALGRRTPKGATIETSDDFIAYLLDAVNVAALPGTAYGVDGYFRISFATSIEQLDEACSRMLRACMDLK